MNAPAITLAALAMVVPLHGALACEATESFVPPQRYVEYDEAFKFAGELSQQRADDVAFAIANDVVVVEGPWDDLPPQQVAYIGIDQCGERVRLESIGSQWRFSPIIGTYRPDDANEELRIAVRMPGEVLPVRIYLGRPIPGMVVGRASGPAPVQSSGIIDGKDYYFRSRGEHWSMSIGGVDVVGAPEWYYEEPYGAWPDAGFITEDQAYDFIEEAASKFRSGAPTMTEHTIDASVASILSAIERLQSK